LSTIEETAASLSAIFFFLLSLDPAPFFFADVFLFRLVDIDDFGVATFGNLRRRRPSSSCSKNDFGSSDSSDFSPAMLPPFIHP